MIKSTFLLMFVFFSLFLSVSSVSSYVCASDNEVTIYCGDYSNSQPQNTPQQELPSTQVQLQQSSNYKWLGIGAFSIFLLVITTTIILIRMRLKRNAR